MRRGIRAARVALFVVAGLMAGAGVAAAQADLAKVLVGTWKGELQQRTQNAGTIYSLSLLDDKNLVGTATLTTSKGSQRDRDRSVKLEKQE
jgi:TRAP-type C4-dicarboxylate transport system permease large subunit